MMTNKTLKVSRANTAVLPPRPVNVTPPLDPPTIRVNPVRNITVSFSRDLTADTLESVGVNDVRGALIDAGYPDGYFAIKHIHAWLDGSANGELELKDLDSGVRSRDDGSFSQRARCGLMYPPVLQTTVLPNEIAKQVATVTADVESSCEFRVGVSWWGA
jgi:hypothetical protein